MNQARFSAKGVVVFLVLCFGLAWSLWELPLWLGVPLNSGAFKFAVVPGAFAPAIAAIIVRKWVTREGFGDAGLSLDFEKWPYYLAAWLIPIAVVTFIAGVAPLFHVARSDFSLQNGAGRLLLVGPQLSVASVVATPILWGEEFGWRSYLQLRLFPGHPLLAAIATGLIWGIWHFPLLVRGSEFPSHPYLSLAIFPVGTILYSVILGWLRVRAESIWAPSFAHSAINNLGGPLLMSLFAAQRDLLSVTLLGFVPLTVFAVLIALSGNGLQTSKTPSVD